VLQAVAACSPQPRRIKSLPPAAAAAIAIAIVIIPPAAVLAPMLITIRPLTLLARLTRRVTQLSHIGLELADALLDICFIYRM
jgi:hypothetical protein